MSSTEDFLIPKVARTYQKKALCRNRPILGLFLYLNSNGVIKMSWRIVYIEKSDYLKLYLDNLKVIREETEVLIPLSDIHTIIVDNQQTIVTARLLNKLADYHILLIFCDEKHLPNIYTLSPHSHHQASRVLERQVQWSVDIKGEMWKKIVQIKISNQASVLQYLKKDPSTIDALHNLSDNVSYSDETNREGHAAKLYFKTLFGNDFVRDRDGYDGINSGLNYGYIVLRSTVARTIVAYGLQPSFGIGHHNQYNAFNLADDLIEPFRPIVDLWVSIMCNKDNYLDIKTKQKLVHLISNNKILIGNQKQTILNAIEILVQTFIKGMNEKNTDLLVYPANGISI